MSLQIRRGTNAERLGITPVSGELIYTTDTKAVFVGDGTTAGGINISVGGTGNITANLIGDVTGNLSGTTISVSGNITGGNLNTGGLVSATGNISGNYILGNGALLTGVITSATEISNGTSNVRVVGLNSNIAVGVNGTSNVTVFATTGQYVTGVVSASGNIVSGNLTVSGVGIISALGNAHIGNILTTGLISATGNVTGGNVNGGANVYATTHTGSTASLSGTITGGNVLTGGEVSAVGNVSGNYIIGNGSFLTGVTTSGTSIINGTSNVTIAGSGSNIAASVGGTANVAVFATSGIYITGVASATGNITGGNLRTGGLVSATGNITSGANLNVSDGIYTSTLSASGTITGGNINTSGLVSATGNVSSAANVSGVTFKGNVEGTTVSITGTVTGGNVSATGSLTGASLTTTGNAIVGGNLVVSGNVTYINVSELDVQDPTISIGRGANYAALVTDDGKDRGEQLWYFKTTEKSAFIGWQNSTGKMIIAANATVANNIATVNSYGTTVVGTLEGTIVSTTGNITGGNLSGTNIVGTLTTGTQTNITSVGTLTTLSVTSTVTGGNLATGGTVSATGAITGANITGANLLTGGLISATGNITGGNLTVGTGAITVGSIVNANANGVGNIGSSTGYFNTVFAIATSAQYADLAENYTADANYEPGTVLVFGGPQEVTISNDQATTRVAGVVSTNPSYLMNAGLTGDYVVAVALQGRVPTKVTGTVRKGDLLVASVNGYAAVDNNARAGSIIGKALQDFDGETGTIEVVVGRC